MMDRFPVGKLPHPVLAGLLAKIPKRDLRVRIGPEIGEDAAVIDMGDRYLVVKTDPITFATEHIGWYLVNINANDIACLGAIPRWLLVTMLLPEAATDQALVEGLFKGLISACTELDIAICGGHSEVTYGLCRPILVGHLIGEVEKSRLVSKEAIRQGDHVLLTKGIAIEGTSVIARELGERLQDNVETSVIEKARSFLSSPGLSVVKEALLATSVGGVHGMHDPTEGGLATGLWELAQRARVGIHVRKEAISVYPETMVLCRTLGLDPMGLLASGALILVVDPDCSGAIRNALEGENIPCVQIGEIRDVSYGVRVEAEGTSSEIHPFPSDELARLFSASK